jgi:toxin-antitoxin system PIN domain toxin
MIGIDTNLLVYAFNVPDSHHAIAKQTLETLLTQKEQVAFTDIVLFEFISQATRIGSPGVSPSAAQAVAALENWLSAPNVKVIRNSPQSFKTFVKLCERTGRTGQEIYDAQIAAICIDNGVTEFITNDKGFEKFTELRIRNPFAA